MPRVHLFCDINVINCLQRKEIPEAEKDITFSMDIIEVPYMFVYDPDPENRIMKIYKRGQMHPYTKEELLHKTGKVTVNRKTGKGIVETDSTLGKNTNLCFKACCKLNSFIQFNHLEDLYSGIEAESAGIQLTEKDGELTYKLVTGKERPDLVCADMFGNTALMRPYEEDMMDNFLRESMTEEELVEEAEDGDVDAMETLAMKYLNGDDEADADPEKAFYWFLKMAQAGSTNGLFNAGLLYAKGHGTKRDFREALHWMKEADSHGDEDAAGLTSILQDLVQYSDPAEKGDADAQAKIARAYMTLGQSVKQFGSDDDFKESVKWASLSAQKNNSEAFWILALAYEHGRGVGKDKKKAVEYYRKGADFGHAGCQHSLGCYYERGEIVQKDDKKAFELFMKSAAQGYALAAKDAGRCYQFGTGVEENQDEALRWYEKSLELQDDPELRLKVEIFKRILRNPDEIEKQTKASVSETKETSAVKNMKDSESTGTMAEDQNLTARVVVGNSIVLWIPGNMKYSRNALEIKQNRLLTAITEDSADDCLAGFAEPFTARRNITVTHPFSQSVDMSDKNLKKSLADVTIVGKNGITVVDNDQILVRYSVLGDHVSYISVLNENGIYNIQYFMNDVEDAEEQKRLTAAFAGKIRNCTEEEKEFAVAGEFTGFTYSEKKSEPAGVFRIPVPDQMESMDEYIEKHPDDSLFKDGSLAHDLSYLAVSKNFEGGFISFTEAPVSINLRKKPETNPVLGKLWTKQNQDEPAAFLKKQMKNYVRRIGNDYLPEEVYTDRKNKVSVVFSQMRELPERQWYSFMYLILHESEMFQGQIFSRTTSGAEVIRTSVKDFLNRIKLLTKEELEQVKVAERAEVLGDTATADGHVNAITVSQFFSSDIVFNYEKDFVTDGKHTLMKHLVYNTDVAGEYPAIFDNSNVYTEEILRVVNETEKNKVLLIPKKYFAKEMYEMTFNRDLSGTMLFVLCAAHMIYIIEKNNDQYVAALEDNLIRGIPEAYKYIAEFIQTLREINGRKSAFDVTFGPTVNTISLLKKPVKTPVPKAASLQKSYSMHVNEGEHPYAGVIRDIDREQENQKKEITYKKACSLADSDLSSNVREASGLFASLGDYKDSMQKRSEADRKISELQKETDYKKACRLAGQEDIISLADAIGIFNNLGNYQDAQERMKAASDTKERLIKEEEERKRAIYEEGVSFMDRGEPEIEDLQKAISCLTKVSTYKDASSRLMKCRNLIGNLEEYDKAVKLGESSSKEDIEKGIGILKSLNGFKDSEKKIAEFNEKIAAIIKKQKNGKMIRTIIFILLAAAIGAGIYYMTSVRPKQQYAEAVEAFEAEDYRHAKRILTELGDYENSRVIIGECDTAIAYEDAVSLMESGEYEEAINAFEELGEYKDSSTKKAYSKGLMLIDAVGQLIEIKNYTGALEYLSQIRELGIEEFSDQVNEKLCAVVSGAYEANDLDTAAKAFDMVSDASLIDEGLAANLNAALEEKRAYEERVAKEKEIEDAYQELLSMKICEEEEIQSAEELFSIIPSDYKDAGRYKKIFDFYKPYLGTYNSEGYSSVKVSLRITTVRKKPFTVFIGDVSESGAAFEYPNMSATNKKNDNNYTTWTIRSANKITNVQVRPTKTFNNTYTR